MNKIVAVWLGAEGLGIIGLFNSTLSMIRTGAGLGISQSAVRDISEANNKGDNVSLSTTIQIVNRIVLITSLLGLIITILLSQFLSEWTFNSAEFSISYMILSLAVAFNIYSDGQLAILKGMRRMRALAKASMIGSFAGLAVALPFYWICGIKGIVPSLVVVAFVSLIFSNIYVNQIKYQRTQISSKQVYSKSKSMVVMGVALMLVTFIGYLFDVAISSYMTHIGSLNMVGYYHAGTMIVSGYFGIIISAMTTDYYPRISAIYNDNQALQSEMNKQAETGLIMVFPLVVLFTVLSKFFVRLLYNESFVITNQYTDYAMIGTVIIIVSNTIAMILLAKQAAKIFLTTVILQRAINLAIYIFLFQRFGLMGLGFAYIILGTIHLVLMGYIIKIKYHITLSRRILLLLLLIILTTLIAISLRSIPNLSIRYLFCSIVFIASCIFTHWYLHKYLSINLLSIIKNRYSNYKK